MGGGAVVVLSWESEPWRLLGWWQAHGGGGPAPVPKPEGDRRALVRCLDGGATLLMGDPLGLLFKAGSPPFPPPQGRGGVDG